MGLKEGKMVRMGLKTGEIRRNQEQTQQGRGRRTGFGGRGGGR